MANLKGSPNIGSVSNQKVNSQYIGFGAIKTRIYLFYIILILLFANGGHIVFCYLMIHQYDLGIWDVLNILFGLNGSLIDNIDLIGIEVLMVISSFSIILGNLSLKSLFIELLDLFHTSELCSVKSMFYREKITLFSIIFSWALCMVSFDVGFTVTLIKEFDIDILTTVLFAFSHLFYVTTNIAPIIGFLIMYRWLFWEYNTNHLPFTYRKIWEDFFFYNASEITTEYAFQLGKENFTRLFIGFSNPCHSPTGMDWSIHATGRIWLNFLVF